MRFFLISVLIGMALGLGLLTACQPFERIQSSASGVEPKPRFNVLRATVDEEDLGDVSIFCIDGVKYVVIPGIGMSVKYRSQGVFVDTDPTVETCINK